MRRVRLTEALHARPANLLVRLAQRYRADVELHHGEKRAVASRILEVLSLGAAKGDELVLAASGEEADAALDALHALVAAGFSSDLVPETAAAAVEGIAIGHAIVVMTDAFEADDTAADTHTRTRDAFARATLGLRALITSLPPSEAQLFEPEIPILDELERVVLARVEAGEAAAAAVIAATDGARTDLVLDARARLLEALAAGAETSARRLTTVSEEAVVITDALTPTLVASLPRDVVGIVATSEDADARPVGFTSHAAILARGRGLPLAYVAPHVAAAIADGELVVIDTTVQPASVWTSPSDDLVSRARARRDARAHERDLARDAAPMPLEHLGVTVRVNISSLDEAIPDGADGVGLLRTELVFAHRHTAPSEADQLAAALAVAARANGKVVVARLFDAGGDKPLSWMPPPKTNPDARGMELLFANAGVLEAQVRGLSRAAKTAKIRILLPLVRSARDVEYIRKIAGEGVPIAAMIETPDAADDAEAIARAADFVCIGTNDLSTALTGEAREISSLSRDPRLFRMVARIVAGAHVAGRTVTVCGELAGDPAGARALVGLGVDALSVSPGRFVDVRRSLVQATREDCQRAAQSAMASSS